MEYLAISTHQWVENILFMSMALSASLAVFFFAAAHAHSQALTRQILGLLLLINGAYYYHAYQQWLIAFVHHTSGHLHVGLSLNLSLYDLKWAILLPLLGLVIFKTSELSISFRSLLFYLICGIFAPLISTFDLPTYVSLLLTCTLLLIFSLGLLRASLKKRLHVSAIAISAWTCFSLLLIPLVQAMVLSPHLPLEIPSILFASVDSIILLPLCLYVMYATETRH